MLGDKVSKAVYNNPEITGTKTTAKNVKLWYLFSNNIKNAIAEVHIMNVLIETKTTESEHNLESSHFKVNRNKANRTI